jgi:hypothetical protein
MMKRRLKFLIVLSKYNQAGRNIMILNLSLYYSSESSRYNLDGRDSNAKVSVTALHS